MMKWDIRMVKENNCSRKLVGKNKIPLHGWVLCKSLICSGIFRFRKCRTWLEFEFYFILFLDTTNSRVCQRCDLGVIPHNFWATLEFLTYSVGAFLLTLKMWTDNTLHGRTSVSKKEEISSAHEVVFWGDFNKGVFRQSAREQVTWCTTDSHDILGDMAALCITNWHWNWLPGAWCSECHKRCFCITYHVKSSADHSEVLYPQFFCEIRLIPFQKLLISCGSHVYGACLF